MAHIKKGLDYFPLDCDIFEDYRIMELIDEYGTGGFAVYIYLLTKIFREGYYIEQPIEKVAAFAGRVLGGKWMTKDQVINVIHFCGDIGLLRVDYLEKGIFTSKAIQERYAEITKRRVNRDREYWLLDEEPVLNVPLNAESVTESADSVTESADSVTFRGINKTKGKKRKENKKEKQAADGAVDSLTTRPTYGLPSKDCKVCGGTGWVIERDGLQEKAKPCSCRKKEEVND